MSQLLIQNIDPSMKVTDPWGCNRILSDINLVMKWGHMTISKGEIILLSWDMKVGVWTQTLQ